ncbi:MAG: hypothetical protein AB4041_18950 [Microcystaceae cyanobacterium]
MNYPKLFNTIEHLNAAIDDINQVKEVFNQKMKANPHLQGFYEDDWNTLIQLVPTLEEVRDAIGNQINLPQ